MVTSHEKWSKSDSFPTKFHDENLHLQIILGCHKQKISRVRSGTVYGILEQFHTCMEKLGGAVALR